MLLFVVPFLLFALKMLPNASSMLLLLVLILLFASLWYKYSPSRLYQMLPQCSFCCCYSSSSSSHLSTKAIRIQDAIKCFLNGPLLLLLLFVLFASLWSSYTPSTPYQMILQCSVCSFCSSSSHAGKALRVKMLPNVSPMIYSSSTSS